MQIAGEYCILSAIETEEWRSELDESDYDGGRIPENLKLLESVKNFSC